MSAFFQAVAEYPFLQNALLAAALSSLAAGVIGAYIVARRVSYVAGGIAHCILGGIGVARYMQVVHGWEWLHPLLGASIVGVAAAVLVGWVSLRGHQREDTLIGALWAVGMAVGVLFMSKTPGYNQELVNYLFGNILMVGSEDLWALAILDGIVLALGLALFRQFEAVCFDQQFARVRGLKVEAYYILLLTLAALTVVAMTSVVGLVLVIALLTAPAAIAGNFTRSLGGMMAVATLLCLAFTTGGLAISYQPDLPPGAVIIVLVGVVYMGTAILKKGRL